MVTGTTPGPGTGKAQEGTLDNSGNDPPSHRSAGNLHNFRIPKPVWTEVVRCVEMRDDESVTWVLLQCFDKYIRETHRRQERGILPPFPDE